MQNKTLKITCAIVGLTLSACGFGVTKNLSAADFPTPPSSNFVQDPNRSFATSGFCDDNGCKAYYPSELRDDLMHGPLNNPTGTAHYTGTFQISTRETDRNTSYSVFRFAGEDPMVVDFNNNTIRYSGQIGESRQIDIRGNFNGRGQITGTTTVEGFSQGHLIGLIGDFAMIGSFTNDNGDFGGGFSLIRD